MHCIQRFSTVLSIVTVLVTQPVLAGDVTAPQSSLAHPAAHRAPIVDVKLSSTGELRGQLVDRQGTPRPGRQVRLVSGGTVLAQGVTDAQGQFAIRTEKGGLCLLSDQHSAAVVRVWPERVAPPSAKPAILMVSNEDVTRANLGNDDSRDRLLGAVIVGGAAAAVIITSLEDEGS